MMLALITASLVSEWTLTRENWLYESVERRLPLISFEANYSLSVKSLQKYGSVETISSDVTREN